MFEKCLKMLMRCVKNMMCVNCNNLVKIRGNNLKNFFGIQRNGILYYQDYQDHISRFRCDLIVNDVDESLKKSLVKISEGVFKKEIGETMKVRRWWKFWFY